MIRQGEWIDYEIPLEDGGAMPIQVCSLIGDGRKELKE